MCDPLSIAGAALTASSTIANTIGANKAAAARDDALAAERVRQGAFDREAQALNAQSQDRYADFGTDAETKAAILGDYFAPPAENSVANTSAAATMPTATNDVVVREMAKKSDAARSFTDKQGAALGQLRAFGDVLADTSRAQGRDAGLVGQLGNFKQGSSNVTPLELDAASQKGQGLRTFGDILGGLGGVALTAGLTGGSLDKLGSLFKGGATASAPLTSARPIARPASIYPQASGVY